MIENAILIAGPTASGKSALALDLARREGGIVVNADSMQVYSVLRVLTARPGAEELATAPHLLYGHVDPRDAYSTGDWLRDVTYLAEEGAFEGRRAIFVGGTGLYFRALLGGLSAMPAIPADIRAYWRARLSEEGAEALHRVLRERDADAATAIGPSDGQRVLRALEVLEASGRSILSWQAEPAKPLVDPRSARKIVIEPERGLLRKRIDQRFDGMVAGGALEEVETLMRLAPDPARPAMKAIGVRELEAFLAGRTTLEQAIEQAKAASRQYAKRQTTWFRHQLEKGWERRESADWAEMPPIA
ncbi:MAG TPA: tRNA (adenosine(37)-N6)-dimethylallyltransferase MiaA [Rhizobiaceae bacterium]|nr:tRNA (adenosine(37)-N6)-dimethylallyltransferase MiaA [Rhizobiaceae bacterium]